MRFVALASFASLVATTIAAVPAQAAVRDFRVPGFTRLENGTPFDVQVHTGAPPTVRAVGNARVLDRLTVEVRRGVLVIAIRGSFVGGWFENVDRTVIDVNVPALAGAAVSGPGNVAVDRVRAPTFAGRVSGPGSLLVSAIEAGAVDLGVSGPGNLTLGGRAQTARVDVSGPGSVRGAGLRVRDAAVSVSGPGSIALNAAGAVRGSVSGPGSIRITGGARCQVSKSIVGSVRCG